MTPPDPRLVELAREVARSLVDDVEREAIQRATARVRERLVGDYAAALEEALVEQLARRGQPSGQGDAAPAPTPEADADTDAGPDAVGWYLYALVDRPDPQLAGQPGLDPDHAVEVVGEQGAVAVGSQVRLALLAGQDGADLSPDGWLAGALRRHEAIVEGAGETVIPMRFGTVYPSRDDVCRLLAANRAAVANELDRLAGAAEWGVKLLGTRARPSSAGREPAATSTGSGAGYLRAKAEARAQTLEAQEAERVLLGEAHERLAASADEATVTPVQRSAGPGPVPLLNASYLVAGTSLPEFERAVATLAEDCRAVGVEVQVTGPWPPYHFTRLELTDPGRAR